MPPLHRAAGDRPRVAIAPRHRSTLPTALRSALLTGLVVALVAAPLQPAAAAPLAPAAPLVPPPGGFPGSADAAGDFTGDGLRDTVALRQTTGTDGQVVCLVELKAGLAGGGTAYPTRVRLPEQGVNGRTYSGCAPTARVMRTPGADQLGVEFPDAFQFFAPTLQVFDLTAGATARYAAGFGPTGDVGVGYTDFDGDGYTDLYTTGSDQGEGVDLFVRRGARFAPFYTSGYTPEGLTTVLDLDHGPGTDTIIATDSNGINTPSATVVDGLTGRTQVLVAGDYYGDPGVFGYRAAVVDIDGDAYPDLAVTATLDGSPPTTQYFVNRCQDGRWKFVETRQRPTA